MHTGIGGETLQVALQPSGAVGGEPFRVQPRVAVYDGTEISVFFVGYVYAILEKAPIEYQALYKGLCNSTDECGVRLESDVIARGFKVPFKDGFATFRGLQLKTAGAGYTLRFIGLTSSGSPFAYVDSNAFTVTIGDPYQLQFSQHHGPAWGGTVLALQPAVAVADRGNNVVSYINSGYYVTVDISTNPTGATLYPTAEADRTAQVIGGVAQFEGLYINEAAKNYGFRYRCSRDLPYNREIFSGNFTVAVGPASTMRFIRRVSEGRLQAGEFFGSPPRLDIRDAGGNLLFLDSSSGVKVSLFDNPHGATLSASETTFVIAKSGIVTFSALSIDKVGSGFRLIFEYYTWSDLTNKFTNTGVFVLSEVFSVDFGPARFVETVVPAGFAWAGAQEMEDQPILRLVDGGGNVLVNNFDDLLTARIVPSLASYPGSRLVLDTTAATTVVSSVRCGLPDGKYGAGHHVPITVEFNFEVWWVSETPTGEYVLADATVNAAEAPVLEINVANANEGSSTYGVFLTGNEWEKTRTLDFLYIAQAGDMSARLALTSPDNSLRLSTTWANNLIDGNKKIVSLVMPPASLYLGGNIVIDTTAPVVVGLDTDVSDGEYGAGELISILVTFSLPVAVRGAPILLIEGIYNVFDTGASVQGLFVGTVNGTDDTVVAFQYQVAFGDMTKFSALSLENASISLVGDAYIRRRSTEPTTDANLSISVADSQIFDAAHTIVVDSTRPVLNATFGVQLATPFLGGRRYHPGDILTFRLSFEKPVAVMGLSIVLYLDTGGADDATHQRVGSAVFTELLADNKTLEFAYRVRPGDDTRDVAILDNGHALNIFGSQSYIRRAATNAFLDANLSTAILNAHAKHDIADYGSIDLYGIVPVVVGVSATTLGGAALSNEVLAADDAVLVRVEFSTPVVAFCDPVVVMKHTYYRNAVYESGNQTNEFIFRYTVGLGDDNSAQRGLFFRHLPNALCADDGTPAAEDCVIAEAVAGKCFLYAYSDNPEMVVDTLMPWVGHSRSRGMMIAGTGGVHIKPEPTVPRNTTVVAVRCLTAGDRLGEVGAGADVFFEVEFQDDVIVSYSNVAVAPTLALNNGKVAIMHSGGGTPILKFFYRTAPGDDVLELDVLPRSTSAAASTFLICEASDGCALRNRLGGSVDVSTVGVPAMISGLAVYTQMPVVIRVWSDKNASEFDRQYTVGEEIVLFVRFDRDVMVTTFGPRIRMRAGSLEDGFALFSEERTAALGRDDTLAFVFTVAEGHVVDELHYVDVKSLDRFYGQSSIFRKSSVPSVEVNYTLPPVWRDPLSIDNEPIDIETTVVPTVVSVSTSALNNSRFAPGDDIYITVSFNRNVMVMGNPYVYMDVGNGGGTDGYSKASGNAKALRRAVFVGNKAPAFSKDLLFRYTVKVGDFTAALDYVDIYSLREGLTDIRTRGRIVQAADPRPQAPVNLDLPQPGTPGSLSYDGHTVIIDGRPPYIDSLTFKLPGESPFQDSYTCNDTIYIEMNFSGPVSVTGEPYILLETGRYDRHASYRSGSGSSSLLFVYHPQPGDVSTALDYVVDRSKFNSAVASFQLNGGSVLADSLRPELPAMVHLNPTRGLLQGTRNLNNTLTLWSNEGIFEYLDLSFTRRGNFYKIIYTCDPKGGPSRKLSHFNDVDVSFASEYRLLPDRSLLFNPSAVHRVGHSVDVHGSIMAVGAPWSNLSVFEVQTVTTDVLEGQTLIPVVEIQELHVVAKPRPEIQSFHTTAGVGETVGGFFTIDYGILGSTRPIPANADVDIMEVYIMTDLSYLGVVTITREPYIFCACDNAFKWTITFHDLDVGEVLPLELDPTLLTGGDVDISDVTTIQNSSFLQGTFTISALGHVSPPIPFNADKNAMINAVASLGLTATNVDISAPDRTGSRFWIITFGDLNGFYDVPQVLGDPSGLSGAEIEIWNFVSQDGRHGPITEGSGDSGISGGFTLTWRGNTTVFLPFDCTARFMEEALEALPVINDVSVERHLTPSRAGFIWSITFIEVNVRTDNDYVLDISRALEPIEYENHLIGSDPIITIDSRNDGEYHPFGAAVFGSYGAKAGAVYIYQKQRPSESWLHAATLTANDTDAVDEFGGAVSLQAGLLVVGGMGAQIVGLYEQQSISCSAAHGYFSIGFRGWRTRALPADVSEADLMQALQLDIKPIQFAYVEAWVGGDGLCTGNVTVLLTIEAPYDRTVDDLPLGADLEPLELAHSTLVLNDNITKGIFEVIEVTKGTRRVNGYGSEGLQSGSAYIFREERDCSLEQESCLSSTWVQEAQLFPTNVVGFERFGFALALDGGADSSSATVAVGAPGADEERGEVYVFYRKQVDGTDTFIWPMLQKVDHSAWVSAPFDNFGHSLALQNGLLVVGAPGRNSGQGGVFVFTLTDGFEGALYSASELLPAVTPLGLSQLQLNVGDHFGFSVALDGGHLVVGCPGRDEQTIYLGETLQGAEPDTGAVYVYHYQRSSAHFFFDHKLVPTNVRRLDRFGHDVDIDGKTIVASGIQDHKLDSLGPWKAVMSVTTRATYNAERVGTAFRLKWIVSNESGVWETRTTRPIPKDTTAPVLKRILEEDLGTGRLLVSRSAENLYDGGFTWSVTFLGQTARQVNLLVADTTMLTGTDARVDIEYVHEVPEVLRGLTHVFTRDENDMEFIEKAFLSPLIFQPSDICGYSVAVHESNAVIGCPNRDIKASNKNTGAAFAFNLNLLDTKFVQHDYDVLESDELTISVERSYRGLSEAAAVPREDILFYFETLDRNARVSRQTFIQHLYGLHDRVLLYPNTYVDATDLGGTAQGRTQFYGSSKEDHTWVDGMYDYRGVSDYVQLYAPAILMFEEDGARASSSFKTTNDTVLEMPNENITLVCHSPGFWPSVFGDLYGAAWIIDDSDGYTTVPNVTSGEFNFDKHYSSSLQTTDELGYDVAVDEGAFLSVSGAPGTEVNGLKSAGSVVVYQMLSGRWTETGILYSANPSSGGRFGDSVAVNKPYGRVFTTVAVGEPGSFSVSIFVSSSNCAVEHANLTLQATLYAAGAYSPQHHTARRGSIGLSGDVLVLGAPGLERVFVYRRDLQIDGSWLWAIVHTIYAHEYDYNVYNPLRRKDFGASVAIDGRTIAIGAPFADHVSEDPDIVVHDDGLNADMYGHGRGRVVLLDADPGVLTLTLFAFYRLLNGTFALQVSYMNNILTTAQIAFNAPAYDVKAALEALANVEEVSVSSFDEGLGDRFSNEGHRYVWSITFPGVWDSMPAITPVWAGFGCNVCRPFDYSYVNNATQMEVSVLAEPSQWRRSDELVASDRKRGDHFGSSLALDGDVLVVGAINSYAQTTTSWDFELGSLQGWVLTGTAFDFQPTYGDNCYLRQATYRSANGERHKELAASGAHCNPRGRYFVGTHDKRPGNGVDYKNPDPSYPQGTVQGDEPTGTMTSQPFFILGDEISFLVGGGCDEYVEYVELLVDGLAVARATGRCEERMYRVTWDVSLYYQRTGTIRVVDASESFWGHINVDDFTFNWATKGGQVVDTATSTDRISFGGLVETAHSGAVYVFSRSVSAAAVTAAIESAEVTGETFSGISSTHACLGGTYSDCEWTQVGKLMASDKRPKDQFGAAVSVNAESGVIMVGSPHAAAFGFYKETPSVYPHTRNYTSDVTDVAGIHWPVASQMQPFFQAARAFTSVGSGMAAVFEARVHPASRIGLFGARDHPLANSPWEVIAPNTRAYAGAGAVYVFVKEREKNDNLGRIERRAQWFYTEHAKITPGDVFAGDSFGAALSLSGHTMVVGAIGHDAYQPEAGATYLYNTGFASVSFLKVSTFRISTFVCDEFIFISIFFIDAIQSEFAVSENSNRGHAEITVLRDLAVNDGPLTLEFATSDLSAQGIDSNKFNECMLLPVKERTSSGCFDYEQTRGLMHILRGDDRGTFTVRIVNDLCQERFMKYVQVEHRLCIADWKVLKSNVIITMTT